MDSRQDFDVNPKAIWITNLPYHTPESEIREEFGKYGKIWKIDNHNNGRHPYTFVHYESEESAREAIAKSEGLEMGGRRIVVKAASKDRKDERRDRPGDRDGGRGRSSRGPPRRDDRDRDYDRPSRYSRYDAGYDRREPPRDRYYDDRRDYPPPPYDYLPRDDRYWPRDDYRRPPSPRDRSPPRRDRYERDLSPPRYAVRSPPYGADSPYRPSSPSYSPSDSAYAGSRYGRDRIPARSSNERIARGAERSPYSPENYRSIDDRR